MPDTPGKALVFVDGNNVVRCEGWARVTSDQTGGTQHLIDLCASWAALRDVAVVIVFDGVETMGKPGERTLGDRCTIVATGGETADTWIEREAAVCRVGRIPYWLVTSDGTLRQTAGPGAVKVLHCEPFAREIVSEFERVMGTEDPAVEPSSGGSPIASTVSDGVRERLEQMRRGSAG